jgi:hypothetical protein
MILARIILDYDFKNADGVTERYPNTEIARGVGVYADKFFFKKIFADRIQSNVDASKKLLFKKIVI